MLCDLLMQEIKLLILKHSNDNTMLCNIFVYNDNFVFIFDYNKTENVTKKSLMIVRCCFLKLRFLIMMYIINVLSFLRCAMTAISSVKLIIKNTFTFILKFYCVIFVNNILKKIIEFAKQYLNCKVMTLK